MGQQRVACLFVFCVCFLTDKTTVDAKLKRDVAELGHETPKELLSQLTTSCELTVENLTKSKLLNPAFFTAYGKLKYAPVQIKPDEIAIIKVRTEKAEQAGTSGILSWQIEGHDIRLVIMWKLKAINAPEKDKSTLWISLTRESNFSMGEWKKLMENYDNPKLIYRQGTFGKGQRVKSLRIHHDPYILEGIMSTGKHPQITVTLSFIEPQTLFQQAILK